MHWNNRLVKLTESDGSEILKLAEVYYDDDNKPTGYAEICTVADDIDEMGLMVNRFMDAVVGVRIGLAAVLDWPKDFTPVEVEFEESVPNEHEIRRALAPVINSPFVRIGGNGDE